MTDQIKELIVENKPNISKSSITTYLSILKNLHIKVFGDNIDVSNFKKADKILKFLEGVEPAKRKTVLSALVVITDNKKYRDQMLKDIEEYKAKVTTFNPRHLDFSIVGNYQTVKEEIINLKNEGITDLLLFTNTNNLEDSWNQKNDMMVHKLVKEINSEAAQDDN